MHVLLAVMVRLVSATAGALSHSFGFQQDPAAAAAAALVWSLFVLDYVSALLLPLLLLLLLLIRHHPLPACWRTQADLAPGGRGNWAAAGPTPHAVSAAQVDTK